MITLTLYRYLHSGSKNKLTLSDAEKTTIRDFFTPFAHNPQLKVLIDILKLEYLAKILDQKMPEEPNHGEYGTKMLNEKGVKKYDSLNLFDENHAETYRKIQISFISAYNVFFLLTEGNQELSCQYTYKLLVAFGNEHDNTSMFQLFDSYCAKLPSKPNIKETLADAFNFELPKRLNLSTGINYGAWRQILNIYAPADLDCLRLLTVADEVEAILKHAPTSYEEACTAATKTRKFKQADKDSKLAPICIVNLVPEKAFNNYVAPDTRTLGFTQIFGFLGAKAKFHFLKNAPATSFTFDFLLSYVDSLTPEFQKDFLQQSRSVLEPACTASFVDVLKKLKTQSAQKNLLEVLSDEFLRKNITDAQKFTDIITVVDPQLHEMFYTKSAPLLSQFLNRVLVHNQKQEAQEVAFKLSGYSALVECCPSIESFFETLAYVNPNLRPTLLINCAEAFKTKYSDKPDFLAFRKACIEMVEDASKKSSLFICLYSADEIKARQSIQNDKAEISAKKFKAGFMGIGGVPITLDNGEVIKTTETVSKIWDKIKLAENSHSYIACAAEIKALKENAKNVSALWHPVKVATRGINSSEFYNSVETPAPASPSKR